jgi:hypothetical protein
MTQQQDSYSHVYEPIGHHEHKDNEKAPRAEPWLTVESLSEASTQIIPCLFAVFINLLDAVRDIHLSHCLFKPYLAYRQDV